MRSNNEGNQPWFSDRKKFHLRESGTIEGLTSEEGLAAIHSIFNANVRYLWLPALQYCKSHILKNFYFLF